MKKLTLKVIALTIILAFISSSAFAQWQVDKSYGFKINIPSNWSKQSHMDGTDKIYDYSSPDQNAAVQLRVFEATPQVTVDILCQAYESSYLPAGTQKGSLVDYTSVNGIPGKQGLYILNYNNTEVTIATFYTIQNNIGYVLSAIIPSKMVEQKGAELKQITHSFIIDGFEKAVVIKKEIEKPKGLSGLLGGTSNNNNNNNNQQSNSGFAGSTSSGISSGGISGSSNNINRDDVVGQYNFYNRSDGKNMTNYHYIIIYENGTYVEKYQPKNSGNYVGGHEGRWRLNGDVITLQLNNSNVVDTYKVKNNFIARTTDSGLVFSFKKK